MTYKISPPCWLTGPLIFFIQGHFSLDNLCYLGYTGDMGTIILKRVPDDLHRSFKAACTLEGTTMREKAMELIREYLKRQEKKAKK